MPKISPFVFIKTSTFTTNKIQYRPLIISGCSGSGKTTLISFLTNNYPSLFELSLSHTTRKPRHTQKSGIDYIFLSQDQFQRNMRNNSYIEYFNVHGNLYGTHADQLQQIVDKGKVCILDMDIQGAEHVYQQFDMWNFLFVKCKSVDVLKDRLQVRGTESKEAMQKRLKNAEKQLKKLEKLSFYTHIVNDSIKQCQKDLIKYINEKYSFNLNSI